MTTAEIIKGLETIRDSVPDVKSEAQMMERIVDLRDKIRSSRTAPTYYGLWCTSLNGWMFNQDGSVVSTTAPGLLFARFYGPSLNRSIEECRVAVIPDRGGEPTEFVDPS